MQGAAQVHDVQDVRLLQAAIRDGPRKASGTTLPEGHEPSASTLRASRQAPSLVPASKGRTLGLEGLATVPTRTA